jgi:pyruvate-ferredoxin/flavodoxin oxidoreductase
MIDLTNPVLLGPVQNQEHYMQGVVARRDNFVEPILDFFEAAYKDFAAFTGRYYGLVSEYKCEDAETVFVSLGSAAENIEAAVDHLRARENASVGSIHINVFRPFPEAAVVRALAGKKNVIILERTDEPMAGDNPMGRDIRTALNKALQGVEGIPKITAAQMPQLFGGVYGLGSRDFRPEHTIGAYEYAIGRRARKDGKRGSDGASFIVLGIDHPYEVKSDDTPSLLPDKAIAVRFHSVGGWGAITTGKNLGAIIGDLNDLLYEPRQGGRRVRQPEGDHPRQREPEIRIGKEGRADLLLHDRGARTHSRQLRSRHVNVVLCCDPKAFTHTNPLDGMSQGGCLVWESDEEGSDAWERLPLWARKQIIDKKIRVFTLPGFKIAREATDRGDLQLRMQGNAFLGAFFSVSPMLQDFGITAEQFRDAVHKQYVKKFGKLGEGVVSSNMEVMTKGFELVREINIGALEAADRSTLRGKALLPVVMPETLAAVEGSCGTGCRTIPPPAEQVARPPLTRVKEFDAMFRAKLGYNQPANAYAALGIMAAGSGDTASKYVARRETPLYIPENCTQCMECIAVCPDTALPNCSQDLDVVLYTAVSNYVSDTAERKKMLNLLPEITKRTREMMRAAISAKDEAPKPQDFIRKVTHEVNGFSPAAKEEFFNIIDKVPMAYQKTNAIFATPEKKSPGSGGIFSIFVSDLCKGCAACVTACGEHMALKMVQETEEVNAEHESGTAFLNLLPDTAQKYLGLYNDTRPQDSKTATLRNMLMVRRNYDALVSGGRRVRGLRREEHPALRGRGHRGLHASALPREGRPLPAQSRRAREGRRAEAGGAEGAQPGRIRDVQAGGCPPADGTWR